MASDFVKIRGARVHNLKNINLDIPKGKLVVITGVSGSGKSSLAFDTLYAEGQRRYIESLSAYARQFLGQLERADVDKIEGLSPAIAIEQKGLSHNPRSTVGTVTEIYDYLRLFFARVGRAHCPKCGREISKQSLDQIIEQILSLPSGAQILILGPAVRGKKGHHQEILKEIERQGFVRVRINGRIYRIEEALSLTLPRYKLHNIEVVVDRIIIPDKNRLSSQDYKDERARIADSVETALKIGEGLILVSQLRSSGVPKLTGSKVEISQRMDQKTNEPEILMSSHFACPVCDISLPEIEPRSFSFNSPYGACPECSGLGVKIEIDPNLVVPDKSLSLYDGAIVPWFTASHKLGRQSWFWYLLRELSEELGFSLDTPWQDLSSEVQEAILYGAPEYNFEGVIPQLKRRFQETSSESTRAEIKKYMVEKKCPLCQGRRLKQEFLAVKVLGKNIAQITEMPVEKCLDFFQTLWQNRNRHFSSGEIQIGQGIVSEIIKRLSFLKKVGVSYLTLDRRSGTLAGGEAQRIKLATQIGSGLSGVLYILDEPSIGLHQRDQARLIKTLKELRDLGNTVIVVEHDRQMIEAADWVIDLGPAGGKNGGWVVAQGPPQEIAKKDTLTGRYLRNPKLKTQSPNLQPKTQKAQSLVIKGCKEHNLKNITVRIPLGRFVCVTGVSGSGKSSLIDDTLARALKKEIYKARVTPGKYKALKGLEHLDRVVIVDQSPIGRTPRSNPATYTGVFSHIRRIFAQTNEARARGYKPGRFSFNVREGRCETCQGQGMIKVEMQFLPDIYVTCESCRGKRYQKEVLEVEYKGKNIAQVLSLTIAEAYQFFKNIPPIEKKLRLLKEIGLEYLELGQPAPTLSGGEAQRIKLAKELTQYVGRHTLYLLDEPTTGLHHEDIKKLLKILRKLVDQGNTILTVEHNLDVISNADWIIDLGPEGGDKGGYIVAEGTPGSIAKVRESWTGKYLNNLFVN